MRHAYLAHPLSGTSLEIAANIKRAKAWFKWACDNYWPDYAFNATWIMNCEVYDDADATDRERGMQRNYAHIKRCDELWLLGPRISQGMEGEARFARRCGLPVYNLTTEILDPTRTPRMEPADMPVWNEETLTQQVMKFTPPGV